MLTKLGVSANAVTIFNMIFTVGAGCYFFSQGSVWANYCALGVLFVNVILDYLDGDIAKFSGTCSPVGVWLDNKGDIFVQNAIMAGIAMGCHRLGLNIGIILTFFVANSTLNMVSLHFNDTFGFESYKGNELFRKYMDTKPHVFNRIFKNIVDPTSSPVGIFLFTVRYWILIGIFFNVMPLCFIYITILHAGRALFMYVIYALHLAQYKKLWLLQALAIIDQDRQEYYNVRSSS